MFKHLSMLFEHQELASLVRRYNYLRINGDANEVAALRKNIASILKSERKSVTVE